MPGAVAILSKRLAELYGPPVAYGRHNEITLNRQHPYVWPLLALHVLAMPLLAVTRGVRKVWNAAAASARKPPLR